MIAISGEMSCSESLPRVLTTAKLHRRSEVEHSFGSSGRVGQESQSRRCPPIENAKEASFTEHDITNDVQPLLHVNNNPQHKRMSPETTCIPLSPASGVSAACVAMANACSHDHDYISLEAYHLVQDSNVRSRTNSPCKFEKCDEVASRQHLDIKTIRIPVPPKPLPPTSPREAKPLGSNRHRRFIRPSGDLGDFRKGRSPKTEAKSEANDSSCIFVSTRKTAEPRRPRTERKKGKILGETQETELKSNEKYKTADIARTSQHTCGVDKDTDTQAGSSDFDVTKDKLTAEWLEMVRECRLQQNKDNEEFSDDSSLDIFDKQPRHSTPIRSEKFAYENSMPSPRASATPCPPNMSKTTYRNNGTIKSNDDNNTSKSTLTEQDSAYFSINSSLGSIIRPTSSLGTPMFRGENGTGSRNLSAGSSCTRPPSGGKRVAATSLSSTSSSGASSDDDSVCSSLASSRGRDEPRMPYENIGSESKERLSSTECSSWRTTETVQDHKAVKARKGKKIIRHIESCEKKSNSKLHINPIPPRKLKKEPLPMSRRALPLSFFQEPNRVSPSPFNILPPLPPLFRQGASDDIADIRPVTPPDKLLQEDPHTALTDKQGVVIKTGDIDLLQRLFDSVEPHSQPTGRRVKRGRPKRAPRIMPSPKLTLNDNPCIMESITEKLFPKLTIERRNNKQFSNRPHGGAIPFGTDKNPGLSSENAGSTSFHNASNNLESFSKDISQFGLLSFNPSLLDDDVTDTSMEMTSPTHASQKQEVFALPQLPYNQDYSQMLLDVASGL